MKMKYRLCSETVLIDGIRYDTYGVLASDEQTGVVVSVYHDVSLDRDAVCRIIDILNGCEVEICHFDDVIENELANL